MKKLLVVFALLAFQNVNAQLNLDSLWGIFHNEKKSDSVRLMAMYFIAYDYYMFTSPDSSIIYGKQMYAFAKKKGELQYQAYALGTLGTASYYLGKMDLSIEYHERAMLINKKLKNYIAMASAHNNIANVYREQGKLADAVDYFVKALKIYEKVDNKQAISTVLGNLGAVSADMHDYESSKKWYKRAMFVKRQTDDYAGLALLFTGIGNGFLNVGQYDSAMYYQKAALDIRRELNNTYGIGYSMTHLGEVFSAVGQLDSAMLYFVEALKIFEQLNLETNIADTYYMIAKVYNKMHNYSSALRYAKRSLDFAEKGGLVDVQRDVSYLLFELFKRKGDYLAALEMHEIHIEMRDRMDEDANQKAVIQQQFSYDYEKKSIADSLNRVREKNIQSLKHKEETEKQRIIIFSTVGGLLFVIGFLAFVFNRLRITKRQKLIIEDQKTEVEEKNREIMDSITYAKRIQSAILPTDKVVKTYLEQSFILYKPKDIVAGDFYWMETVGKKVLFAAADCTGHGVPGAMVSVVCNNALNRSVREHGLQDPGEILNKSREIVVEEFEKSHEDVKDGMDIALCSLKGNTLEYAGANNPLWIVQNGEIIETKANKQPIGKFDNPEPYSTHKFELKKGDTIYVFSDGFVDQFGGPQGKKYKAVGFRELLLSIQDKSMMDQKELIDKSFETWKGELEQIDDVCIIGVRI